MAPFLRSLRLGAHVMVSVASWFYFLVFRRSGVLVFRHQPDIDGSGRDAQLGPLVEALRERGARPIEVWFVPLDGGLLQALAVARGPLVSHAALLLAARILSLVPGLGPAGFERAAARLRVARGFLASLGPRSLVLIDESGSGQFLLRGARSLGIRTLGVQHGDFQPHNPQYGPDSRAEPADLLCLWSPWFQGRLLAISRTYDEGNTRVVGRLRFPEERLPDAHSVESRRAHLRVLLISQPGSAFRELVRPYVEALRSDPAVEFGLQLHPGDSGEDWPVEERRTGSLVAALATADVVCGVDSSALLEALYRRRPVVVLRPVRDAGGEEPADDYASRGVASACAVPEQLSDLCRSLAHAGSEQRDALRARVWGDVTGDSVQQILAALDEDRNTLRSAA